LESPHEKTKEREGIDDKERKKERQGKKKGARKEKRKGGKKSDFLSVSVYML